MGTQTRIKIIHNEKPIAALFIGMDGHTWNFAPRLAKALSAVEPNDIIKVKQLFKFLSLDALYEGGPDEHLDYLCTVDISSGDYVITVYKWKQELLFQGSLKEFEERFVSED